MLRSLLSATTGHRSCPYPQSKDEHANLDRLKAVPTGQTSTMFRTLRTMANPFTRTALIAFAWSHRRTILRWGRSFWTELRRPGRISPTRLAVIGRVLWTITREDQLAKAKQLRHVELVGSTLIIDTAPGWKGTARLVDELGDVGGITSITDSKGNVLAGTIPTTAA